MNQTKKIRVAVLYGGRSGEHEVSLLSANNVIQNLDRSLFEVLPIGIDKQGNWYLGDDVFQKELSAPQQLTLQREDKRLLFNPDLIGKSLQTVSQQYSLEQYSLKGNRLFDVVFPVMHGPLCEDGTVQGLLEMADIPYVGCGVLASALGMDKDVSKRLVQNAGISIPPFLTIKSDHWKKNSIDVADVIASKLKFPVFVKPANTGSSVGIHKVKNKNDLSAAIENAFLYDTKVIIEQGIEALEIEVAILESLDSYFDPIISIPGEIRPSQNHEFYSYASKYLDENGAELIIPAPISESLQEKIREVAKKIFLTLECEGMARVDLFLEKNTDQIYFNEINTIPGFTQISMYPKLMAASGVPYKKLLTHLVMLSVNRHHKKSQLHREYVPA